jgi:hypothetical protein
MDSVSFSKEIYLNGENYILELINLDDHFTIRLLNKLRYKGWSEDFYFDYYNSVDDKWRFFFDIKTLIASVKEIIENNSFTIVIKDDIMYFSFVYTFFRIAGSENKLDYSILLKPFEMDNEEKFEILFDSFNKIEETLENQKLLCDSKIQDFQNQLVIVQDKKLNELKNYFINEVGYFKDEYKKTKWSLEELSKRLSYLNNSFEDSLESKMKNVSSIYQGELNEIDTIYKKEVNSLKLYLFEINRKIDNLKINDLKNELKAEIDHLNYEENAMKLSLEELKKNFRDDTYILKLIVDKNKKKLNKIAPIEFIGYNPNQKEFNLSNNNRTIKRVNGNSDWCGMMIDDNIPMKGIYSFKVRIDKTNSNIMVGFGLKTADGSQGYYRNSYMFYLNDSHFTFCNTLLPEEKKPSIKIGDTISVIIELNKTTVVRLEKNCSLLTGPISLELDERDLENMFPCIDLTQDNIITILELN